MPLKFTKMHGLGNDFIIIDATKEKADLLPADIKRLANRRTGIGFDQLLVIEPSPQPQFDFVYRIFNADGSEVEQCGNGARCVAHYIFSEHLSQKENIVLSSLAGRMELRREDNGEITVNMGPPEFQPEKIPFITAKKSLHYDLILEGLKLTVGAVSLGNPHVVIKVDQVTEAPVSKIGQAFQQHPAFPKQVNVGFMEIVSPEFIRLRVFERGVGETLACGSGACAAVIIGRLWHHLASQVTVELPGGCLTVNWPQPEEDVYLRGPAEKVFKGELIA